MKPSKLLILFPLLIFLTTLLSAQNGNIFNLNSENGLPSNHVYATITDRHGYLWIATTEGVIRYNGYELKIFTTKDGLPINDVWQLIEDDKGRIWLGCIANKMGYIYNEKYYNATFATKNSHTIYPLFLKLNAGHINFFSNYSPNTVHHDYFIERNDTIFNYSLTTELSKIIPDLRLRGREVENITAMTNEDETRIIVYGSMIYQFKLVDNKIKILKKTHVEGPYFNGDLGSNCYLFTGNYIVLFHFDYQNYFELIDINTGRKQKISLRENGISENIINVYANASSRKKEKVICVFTKNHIIRYSLNGIPEFLSSVLTKNELQSPAVDGHQVNSYISNDFWGHLTATNANGLNIKYDDTRDFKACKQIDLKGYKYLGGDGDDFFWINDSNNICMLNNHLAQRKIDVISEIGVIHKAIRKDENNFYFVGKNCYIFNTNTFKATQLKIEELGVSVFNVISAKKHLTYLISNTGFYTLNSDSGVHSRNFIDYDRYRNLIFDSLRGSYWAYNQNKILIYHEGKKTYYTQDNLSQLGIERAEKICTDNRYGNLFLKGNETITIFDQDKKSFIKLFPDLNLTDCSIAVDQDILIVYGKPGVLFCKIMGRNRISEPIFYQNIKNCKYNSIYDAQICIDKVIINTDKGVYSIDIPDKYESIAVKNCRSTSYRFIGHYKNQTLNLHENDTIRLTQNDLRLRFDLINPYGNGEIKYVVSSSDSILELTSNEYTIPAQSQSPGTHYKISLTGYDKVWRSKALPIILYIEPYWWQTSNMLIIIWVSGTVFVIFLFTIAILITRHLVLNATQKRNMRMEMELKAIYSQINPHFIFNSLNSALLLVSKNRMDEAYAHISKFSKLLRSYIKSSRNKFISVEEEIINLQIYIELQQIRFKDRFSYEINSDLLTNKGIKIPSLLLQPFVENAIEHGLLNKNNKGHLAIKFVMANAGTLICTIEDDGIGREKSKKISGLNLTKDESYGQLLIKDLVSIFNKYENMNMNIDYQDKIEPENGTVVTITIKYL